MLGYGSGFSRAQRVKECVFTLKGFIFRIILFATLWFLLQREILGKIYHLRAYRVKICSRDRSVRVKIYELDRR
jgi:hypothetical protein